MQSGPGSFNIVQCGIHLNQRWVLWSIDVWCLVFGHSFLPVHSGGRLLLGGSVRATVVVDRSIPTPCSDDLRWRVIWLRVEPRAISREGCVLS